MMVPMACTMRPDALDPLSHGISNLRANADANMSRIWAYNAQEIPVDSYHSHHPQSTATTANASILLIDTSQANLKWHP